MSGMYGQSFVRVRAPLATDRYQNRKRDWAAAERVEISGVSIQPAGSPPQSSEDVADRQTTVTGWGLYSRPGTDIDLLETDRVEYGGMTLEVDGKVGRWPAPGGGVHHVEARLREVD